MVGAPPPDAQPTAPPREDLPLMTPSSVPPSRPGYDRPGQSLDVNRRASGKLYALVADFFLLMLARCETKLSIPPTK